MLGNLSQAQWDFVLNQLNNGVTGNYFLQDGQAGGTGRGYTEQSDAEAFYSVSDRIDNVSITGGWKSTAAGSFQTAFSNFTHEPAESGAISSDNNTVTLGQVNISDGLRKIQEEAYQTEYYSQTGLAAESTWDKIWNSKLARWIVPDQIGINGTVSNVVGAGFNLSAKIVILTRGKDAWKPSLLLSGSLRVGFDIGISATEEKGWYNGDARKATLDGLLGDGQDISLGIGPLAGGVWRSLDSQGQTTWFGIDEGAGIKAPFLIGASAGQSVTVTPSGFGDLLKRLFP
ncbi:hypothetical protein ACFJIV_11675 [Mucilaginibacter sp. UC70_90]